ncbi:probable mediator of RNA polymerase II transcription subunit 19b [Diospyros lotus]|uniref:probable mediator of RNA polymerase II transcription subunit 19b n=1 Tax=Diospyros lotus TaxID=55363 RepID=UPI00224C939B|nr:probable mediator of RNA polymerase II transcription subunit 19b [Diospyros lotus]
MDPEGKKFGRGPRELIGAVDLISHYKLLPHHEFFCKRSLPLLVSDTHYLHNVVGDTEIRKGEGMQLDQLIQEISYSKETNARIQPFDLDALGEAFQLKETTLVDLPPAEKGIPTIVGKSKNKSKDKEKKHKKHKDKDRERDKEHKKHKWLQGVVKDLQLDPTSRPNFQLVDNHLLYKGRLYLPKGSSLISLLLHEGHDGNVGRHSGFLKTYKRIVANVYWPGMKRDIHRYVSNCVVCQQNKVLALKPGGLLQPLPIPNQI